MENTLERPLSENPGARPKASSLKTYLKEFVVTQKCVPWRVLVGWRSLVAYLRDLPFVETIDLEKTYSSCFVYPDALKDIIESKSTCDTDHLIKNSTKVKFLKQFKDKTAISDDEIKESLYYRTALIFMRDYGSFQGQKNEAGLLKYSRSFLNLYHSMQENARAGHHNSFVHAFRNYLKYGYPQVYKIPNSDHCMVNNGNHRLACQYVLGQRFVQARILGILKNPFKD